MNMWIGLGKKISENNEVRFFTFTSKIFSHIKNWHIYFFRLFGKYSYHFITYYIKLNGKTTKVKCRGKIDKSVLRDIIIKEIYTKYLPIEKNDMVVNIRANIEVFSLLASFKCKKYRL